jgi:hypothetical protein
LIEERLEIVAEFRVNVVVELEIQGKESDGGLAVHPGFLSN